MIIHPREHDLVIGTFGRAAWVMDDIRPLRAVAANKDLLQQDIALFTPPAAYQAAYQQPTGSRFGADALYNAENKRGGAMITYYLKKGNTKAEKKKKKDDAEKEAEEVKEKKTTKDSIRFEFFDGDRLIRTLKYKTPKKAGFHRIYWGMDEKGPNRPSRTIRKQTREPGGLSVKPGTYTIKMYYGDSVEETKVTVKSDPRLKVSASNINEVYTAVKQLNEYTQTAADAVKQLVESKNTAKKYQKELNTLDKKKYKDQIKASKEVVKEIDSLIAIYIGKEDKRQGITRNPEVTVMQRIGTASGYSRSRKTGITATEKRLIEFVQKDLKKALDKTNTFFADKWGAYKSEMEALDTSSFKEIKTFGLN